MSEFLEEVNAETVDFNLDIVFSMYGKKKTGRSIHTGSVVLQ